MHNDRLYSALQKYWSIRFGDHTWSDSVKKLTLVYAENGRGKTTLAAVLRSLGSGDPVPIIERRHLAAANPPHVVVTPRGGAQIIFQNGAWSRRVAAVAVFDGRKTCTPA